MLPYFLLLSISVLVPFVISPNNGVRSTIDRDIIEKRNKLAMILFFSGFFILLAMRGLMVGADLQEYKLIFEKCHNSSFGDLNKLNWEIGYTFYNKIIASVFYNYRFFLVITALITLIPIYMLYSREKSQSVLLIMVFINMPCFLMIFSGLRQAISISIGILAYFALEKRKYIRSVLLILLAVSFHVSAFVLVLIYPAFFFKIKSKHLFFLFPAIVGIYLFRTQIFLLLLNYVPAQYLQFYGELQQTGAFGMMLLMAMFLIFSYVILDEESLSSKEYFMRNILLIATIFQFFVPIHGLVQRASYYFLIFVPVSLKIVVNAPKRKFQKVSDVAVVVITVFFAVYFFYNATTSTDNLLNVFPYRFYWSKDLWY